jgi:hypothetical protein
MQSHFSWGDWSTGRTFAFGKGVGGGYSLDVRLAYDVFLHCPFTRKFNVALGTAKHSGAATNDSAFEFTFFRNSCLERERRGIAFSGCSNFGENTSDVPACI